MPTLLDATGTLEEPARSTPIMARPDVLIIGAGAAGLAAAAAASRAGASTLLIERHGFLGGTLSAVTLGGLCGTFRQTDEGLRPVVGGLWNELQSRMQASDALGRPRVSTIVRGVHGIPYDPERLKQVADEWMAAAKVNVLTNVVLADVQMRGADVSAVLVHTVAGRRAIVPRVVIDASGDAELVALAGGWTSLAAEDAAQRPSAMFRMAPVDRDAFGAISRHELTRLLEAAVAAGSALPRTTVAVFPYLAGSEMHLNATRVTQADGRGFNLLDPVARAAAEREGRTQVFAYEKVFRERVPGFERARVTVMGATLGVREGRRIHGDAELTEAAVMQCEKPQDLIACCAWPVEDHGSGRETVWRPLPAGDWYGISFGCLLPRGLGNVLTAGRCLSATHTAQASARISGACFAMGEAAGTAAAMALNNQCNVRVDVSALQRTLRLHGAILDPNQESVCT
jgi:hypothetical protein